MLSSKTNKEVIKDQTANLKNQKFSRDDGQDVSAHSGSFDVLAVKGPPRERETQGSLTAEMTGRMYPHTVAVSMS